MSDPTLITLTVNGDDHDILCEPRRLLSDVLRHDLTLTGTHVACEHGVCGACTVLVDGSPVRSCLMFAVQAEGAEVRTVESLGAAGELGDLQRAFSEHHGLQCGFCTPGFLMLAEGFLNHEPDADRETVREAVSANLCRCTGYQTIVDAVTATAIARRAPVERGPEQPAEVTTGQSNPQDAHAQPDASADDPDEGGSAAAPAIPSAPTPAPTPVFQERR